MLSNGIPADGEIEPRAAGAWLAQALAKEAGGAIRLSEPTPEILIIGAVVPGQDNAALTPDRHKRPGEGGTAYAWTI